MLHVLLISVIITSTLSSPPFKPSKHPTSLLYTVAERGRSNAELLLLDSIAGNLARTKSPSVYRVNTVNWRNDTDDSYAFWLKELEEKGGIVVNDTLIESNLVDIVAFFLNGKTPSNDSYVLCNSNDTSVNVAITLAAIGENLLVAGDSITAKVLEDANVQMYRDVREFSNDYDAAFESSDLDNISKSVFVFQKPGSSSFLADWSILQRAIYMQWNTSSNVQNIALQNVSKDGASAYGWGPENDYVSTLNGHGVWVHASDYCKNLAALANGVVSNHVKTYTRINAVANHVKTRTHNSTTDRRHTVSFLMSDGDNLQWTMGPWSTSENWYGSKSRGKIPMGWTLSPALADVAPASVSRIVSTKTENDEFVAGPSGYGYVYPSILPSSNRSSFSRRTVDAMSSIGMSTVNILGQNNDAPVCDEISDFLIPSNIPGAIVYPFGDGYAAYEGMVWACMGKPLLSARWSLWGDSNDTKSDMVGVNAMIEKLLGIANQTDPTSSESYSLIAVHAWSHTYSDVAQVASALQDDGRFELVLPSEMLSRVGDAILYSSYE